MLETRSSIIRMSSLVCALLVSHVSPAIGQDREKFYVEFSRLAMEHRLDDLNRRVGAEYEAPTFWAGNAVKVETGMYLFNRNFAKTARTSIYFVRWARPLTTSQLSRGKIAYNELGLGLDMFLLKRIQPSRFAPFVGGGVGVSSSSFRASESSTKYTGVGIHLRPRAGLELDVLHNRLVVRGEIGRVFSITGDHELSQTGQCVGFYVPGGGCFARVAGSVAGFVGDFSDVYQGWSVSYIF